MIMDDMDDMDDHGVLESLELVGICWNDGCLIR